MQSNKKNAEYIFTTFVFVIFVLYVCTQVVLFFFVRNFCEFVYHVIIDIILPQDLLEVESLSLDCLFHMPLQELDQLVLKHSMVDVERNRLYYALDHLSMFYGECVADGV